MSELRADTITASDGTSPVTLTKQSASKAWLSYKGTDTVAIRDSFNISGVVDNGTGNYTPSFSNVFDSISYSASGGAGSSNSNGFVRLNTPTASSQDLETRASNAGTTYDEAVTRFTAHGDLA
jgi:hypothetical protein